MTKLLKVEDPAGYAQRANEGILLGYPVSIGGSHTRGDNGIKYHSTIKYFDPQKDHLHKIHDVAQHLPLNPPDAKNTQIKFDKFKDRFGKDVHAITLHGNSAEKLKEHNGKFAGMGFPATFEWTPHISVDKDTWDKVQASGAKTAHEAGIKFGSAELKHGPKTVKTYHHQADTTEPRVPDESDFTAKMNAPVTKAEALKLKPLMKPYVSEAQRRWAHTSSGKEALGGEAGVHEWDEATKGKKLPEKVSKNDLEKGALKNAMIGGAALLASHGAHAASGDLHQYVSGLNKLPGVKVESKFSPYGKNNRHGEGQYNIKVGKYSINGTHNSNGAGSKHSVGMSGPKNPSAEDAQDRKKAQFLKDKLSTTGTELLEKFESVSAGFTALEKGALKNAGIALGMVGALAGSAPQTDAGNRSPASIQHAKPKSNYDRAKMLRAISQVESSGGQNINHKPTLQGTAFGKYALMPNTIHDTIKGHKDLKAKHGRALALNGPQLHRYMQDHKGLEDVIANRHLAHIEHNFGNDADRIGFAWNQGVTGTKHAKDKGVDIASHPYTKKIREAYGKEK